MPDLQKTPPSKRSMWHRLGFPWLGKDSRRSVSPGSLSCHEPTTYSSDISSLSADYNNANPLRPISRSVGVGLPRHATFKRQNSERRDRLYPNESGFRRAFSADRRRPLSCHRTRSPPPIPTERLSAPEVQYHDNDLALPSFLESAPLHFPEACELDNCTDGTFSIDGENEEEMLERELDKKWILNLSMHFRDHSEREKFFVTYIETPNRWRRVTISCDYRNAEPESLEQDLKELYYQRDKNSRIYESLRGSIAEIQFFETVTNLKLETSDGRLHVHVTEDMNEIIPYPPISAIEHLGPEYIRESELSFDSHLSGFAYQVKMNGKYYVKKEIPGPETVNEFLYEINALYALAGSESVIQLKGIVVDDNMTLVKGILINFAEKGALVDLFYDYKGTIEWARRERWARQTIQGLAEIHEAGFVQGDFTVSNVVVDADDNAKIIDINRRGCPVGWEPPEFTKKLESKQKISMYIGVKSDLYQLGMTLWAIAMEEDEPGKQLRPFIIPVDKKIPDYYRNIVDICLSTRPQDRLSAKELLALFPQDPVTMTNERTMDVVDNLAPLPVEISGNIGCLDEDPPQWNDGYLDQPADNIRLISSPNSVCDSEDVAFYDPEESAINPDAVSVDDLESQYLDEFGDLHMDNAGNPRDFTADDIELEPPSSTILSSAIHDTLPFEHSLCTPAFPEILTGVGRHPSCGVEEYSLEVGNRYAEPSFPERDSLSRYYYEIGDPEINDPDAEVSGETESQAQIADSSSQSLSFVSQEDLLTSCLPINPAFTGSFAPEDDVVPALDFDNSVAATSFPPDFPANPSGKRDSLNSPAERCEDLFLSDLPINPPFKGIFQQEQQHDQLSLPISPAFKDSSEPGHRSDYPYLQSTALQDVGFSVSTRPRSPVPQVQFSEKHPSRIGDLLSSKLPINPFFKDPPEARHHGIHQTLYTRFIQDANPSIPLKSPSSISRMQSTGQDTSFDDLLSSKLPINPAFKDSLGSRQRSSFSYFHSCDRDIVSVPSRPLVPYRKVQHNGQDTPSTDDLCSSKLPINPAFKDPSGLGRRGSHSCSPSYARDIIFAPGPCGLHPQVQLTGQVTSSANYLDLSKMPIIQPLRAHSNRQAAFPSRGIKDGPDPSVVSTTTFHPPSSGDGDLFTSKLPINPAFTNHSELWLPATQISTAIDLGLGLPHAGQVMQHHSEYLFNSRSPINPRYHLIGPTPGTLED
ncbi:serine/threonine protein kinase [Helicocarpus griseus UAMH5409]|uniref:Serine/threonine protein kinase n=1 Tax=Helicocarpus griseus UAMH5409 TaxID=1447875 RepID=A0A2B7X3S9_9EURO|nr:serine/threonine protein kinase [Helicocarpus griseus UAMH5409]